MSSTHAVRPTAPAKKKVLPTRPKIMKPRTAKDVPDPTRYESPTQPANVANSVHGGPYNPYGPPTPAPPKPAPTPTPQPAPPPTAAPQPAPTPAPAAPYMHPSPAGPSPAPDLADRFLVRIQSFRKYSVLIGSLTPDIMGQ